MTQFQPLALCRIFGDNLYSFCLNSLKTKYAVSPFLCLVPSAPPQSLSGIAHSSTVVSLTWFAPPLVSIHGILQYYVVKLREQETGRMWTFVSVAAQINIGSLHPYYNYECTVAAHTIAGTGLYTGAVVVQTHEAGLNIILSLALCDVNFQ